MTTIDSKIREIFCDKGRDYISYCIYTSARECPKTCRYYLDLEKQKEEKDDGKIRRI